MNKYRRNLYLDMSRELLEERGWDRGVQESKMKGSGRLETVRELDENVGCGDIEDKVDHGGEVGNEACDEASQELQHSLLEVLLK